MKEGEGSSNLYALLTSFHFFTRILNFRGFSITAALSFRLLRIATVHFRTDGTRSRSCSNIFTEREGKLSGRGSTDGKVKRGTYIYFS